MSDSKVSDRRHDRATQGISALGAELAEHEVLSVQCPHSHHVGAVYETAAGLVYRSMTGPHAHGRMDRPDVAHHGSHHGVEYVELLDDPQADEALPGWCDCGPWQLSRADILADVRAQVRTSRVG
jgi:hypothetical protein